MIYLEIGRDTRSHTMVLFVFNDFLLSSGLEQGSWYTGFKKITYYFFISNAVDNNSIPNLPGFFFLIFNI